MALNTEKKFDFEHLFVFEMANNHQGDVEHGKRIIREFAAIAKKHGVKGAIKLQFRDIDTFIHPAHKDDTTNKHIPRFISTKLFKEDFKALLNEIEKQGLITMTTPFDEKSVDLLEEFDVDIIKIGSPSAQDWPLLERVSKVSKPIIISTGGLTLKDIDNIVSFFEHRHKHFALMHCVSIYPTPPEKLRLNKIKILKERYPKLTIGFSTHEDPGNYNAVGVALAKGARMFERHIGIATDKIKLNAYSSTPEQIDKWVLSYKQARASLGHESDFEYDEMEAKDLFSLSRGTYAKRDIKRGDRIGNKDVFFAIPLKEGQMVSGKFREGMVADKDYKLNDPLSSEIKDTRPLWKKIIYSTIHEVKGMLHQAKIPIFEGGHFNVELSHHYGIERLPEVGAVILDFVNREYCKKIIIQLPGQRHPNHYHKQKEETFHVLYGEFDVDLEGRVYNLKAGDMLTVERGTMHSFWTDKGVIFEEISSTHFNNDSFYEDPKIDKMKREDRKTKLVSWGRHQFDNVSQL